MVPTNREKPCFLNASIPPDHRLRLVPSFSCFIQILVLSSCLLPFLQVKGLATTTTTRSVDNLSLIENLLLRSRQEAIKNGIQKEYSSEISSVDARAETMPPVSFIFPGAGGVDDLILELKSTIPNATVIDWKDYRGSFLTASYDSEAVGEAVAETLLPTIGSIGKSSGGHIPSGVRFIGVSVGAFAANAAATVVHRQLTENSRTENKESFPVELVLLDPFCGRGVFGPNYGRDNFGKHASTAIQILNTDDPVPTTNDPLPRCYCLDVTAAPEKRKFVPLPGDSMHSWPLAYYTRYFKHTKRNYPRGIVEKAS